MATTLYSKFQTELIFWKDGRKTIDGRPLLEMAMFMFIKIADNKNFVMPYPMDDIISFQGGANFGTKGNLEVVGINVYERKTAIPHAEKICGCQFFGDV